MRKIENKETTGNKQKKVSTRSAQSKRVNTKPIMDNITQSEKSQENSTKNIQKNGKEKRLNEVIRVKKRPSRYVMIDKTFLEDDRLSFKAKGILAYLLSKPDNWKVIVGDLVKRSKDGRDSVYTGLKELKECGYYEKKPIRNENGTIVRYESIVFEVPKEEENPQSLETSLLTDFPYTANPETENPYTENPERNNNYINNNYNLNNNESSLVLSNKKEDQTGQDKTDAAATLKAYEEILKENIRYNDFCVSYPKDTKFLDELLSIMLDVVMSKSEYITINKEQKPRVLVKSEFMKLSYDEIEQVISQYKKVTTKITRKKQYLLAMLYNVRSELEAGTINDLEPQWK